MNWAVILGIDYLVNYVGVVINDEIGSYLVSATVFVLPSQREGVPVSIVEAIVVKVFVIATNVKVVPEMVHDSLIKYIVQRKVLEMRTDRLIRLLSDDSFALEMERKGNKNSTSFGTEFNQINLSSMLKLQVHVTHCDAAE